MGDVEIRRVEGSAGIAEIARFARVLWHQHYPGIISRAQIEYMLDLGYGPGALHRDLARGVVYERASVDGALAGFAAWGPVGGGGDLELHKLYVAAAQRRGGIAYRLVERACAAAAWGRHRAVVLTVNKRNLVALRAYRRLGFRVREPLVREIGRGFVCDDYRMERPVGGPVGGSTGASPGVPRAIASRRVASSSTR